MPGLSGRDLGPMSDAPLRRVEIHELPEEMQRDLQIQELQYLMQEQQARQSSNNTSSSGQPKQLRVTMSSLDDIPIHSYDLSCPPNPQQTLALEAASRSGDIAAVRSIVASQTQATPRFLDPGLRAALFAGHPEIARYILSAGAFIGRAVPREVVSAPDEKQVPLFEILVEHGWNPNTPGYYGEVLLRSVVTKPAVVRWFLEHGADPNLGAPLYDHDPFGSSVTTSCKTLEHAALLKTAEVVRALLDAGARIENGVPLHRAAGAHPEGTNIHYPPVRQTWEEDVSRIPVMELLVERGADVNRRDESRHMVPRLPVLLATMAGAVGRVRWLLDHGADPEKDGTHGNAVDQAHRHGSEEMKKVIKEWMEKKEMNKS
ncbi:MAG: hypothetical protein M1828_005677 [Chrysothrix sp. TS-e1954]|nr:MAG: hypothetical protein M1828_005677 [Chrysothrix sp. TS-e1954]